MKRINEGHESTTDSKTPPNSPIAGAECEQLDPKFIEMFVSSERVIDQMESFLEQISSIKVRHVAAQMIRVLDSSGS